jgi:hypothetical protein
VMMAVTRQIAVEFQIRSWEHVGRSLVASARSLDLDPEDGEEELKRSCVVRGRCSSHSFIPSPGKAHRQPAFWSKPQGFQISNRLRNPKPNTRNRVSHTKTQPPPRSGAKDCFSGRAFVQGRAIRTPEGRRTITMQRLHDSVVAPAVRPRGREGGQTLSPDNVAGAANNRNILSLRREHVRASSRDRNERPFGYLYAGCVMVQRAPLEAN